MAFGLFDKGKNGRYELTEVVEKLPENMDGFDVNGTKGFEEVDDVHAQYLRERLERQKQR
jgi:hypothetical protein